MSAAKKAFSVRSKEGGTVSLVRTATGETLVLDGHLEAAALAHALIDFLTAEASSGRLAAVLGDVEPEVGEQTSQDARAYTLAEKRRKNPRAYQPWSPAEEQRLLDLTRAGHSVGEVAKALGRNTGAIRSRLQRIAEQGTDAAEEEDTLETPTVSPPPSAPRRSSSSLPPPPPRTGGGQVTRYGTGMVRSPGAPEPRLGYTCTSCGRFVADGSAHDC